MKDEEKKTTVPRTFEETIKAYLDDKAENDELFAATYAKENKSLKECCKYIMREVKKQANKGFAACQDEVVYGMAMHYYDEDDIKVGDAPKAKVTVSEEREPSADKRNSKKAKIPGKAESAPDNTESDGFETLEFDIPLF